MEIMNEFNSENPEEEYLMDNNWDNNNTEVGGNEDTEEYSSGEYLGNNNSVDSETETWKEDHRRIWE